MSAAFPGGKDFATLQARCALAGRSLVRIHDHTGQDVVILLDRAGKPHRVHSIEQLEDALLGIELARQHAEAA